VATMLAEVEPLVAAMLGEAVHGSDAWKAAVDLALAIEEVSNG
jgi:hypothetical protein